jgi:coenzyme PQQ biosynthesis protein PqqD
MALALDDRPALWRLARLQYDDVRQQTALLYPEGLLLLNESGTAILSLCDGNRSVGQIATELSAQAGQDVLDDVVEYLEALIERGLVRVAPPQA